MAESTTLGAWLRRERESQSISLRQIADHTKLSIALLAGLETGDVSRWPGGIFRRAYVRSYATFIGLDAELVVKRFEAEHPSADAIPTPVAVVEERERSQPAPAGIASRAARLPAAWRDFSWRGIGVSRVRAMGALADLTVALAIGLGFAASGSRLLWPVLAIAAYHALGALLTGTTPMIALLSDSPTPTARPAVNAAGPAPIPRPADPRPSRRGHRGGRPHRASRQQATR